MLKFDAAFTAAYYDQYGDRESARWQLGARARMQYAIYCHHLRERIHTGDRVFDAGCGPGTFTTVMLALGARVSCLDISSAQLALCQKNAPGAETYERGSITDLGQFKDNSFDVSLALGGPLSYCFDRAADALGELIRVTRSGGQVGLSVMNLYGSVHQALPEILAERVEVNRRILSTGDLPRDINKGHECHMFRVEELRALLSDAGLKDLELFAENWLIPSNETEVPEEGTDAWNMLLEAELGASAESPGAGTRIISWARVSG